MKKLSLVIIALILALSMFGCSDKSDIQKATGADDEQTSTIEKIIEDAGIECKKIEPAELEETNDLSVAFNAYDITGTDDRTYRMTITTTDYKVVFIADIESGEFLYDNIQGIFDGYADQLAQ